jgi:osmotically-inducible protein OsmY
MSKMTTQVKHGLADLRDTAAESLSADGGAAYHEGKTSRAIERLADRIDRMLEALDERIDVLDDTMEDRFSKLEKKVSKVDQTSWFTRLFWMLVGAGAGAAAAALMDPQTGAKRRNQLVDQTRARSRDIADEARKRADFVAGQAKGAVVESAKQAAPESIQAPDDPKTLRDRIRSEVIGHVGGGSDIVVTVHSEGQVTLKGTVPSNATEMEVCERVRKVPGVRQVDSELTVTNA